MVDDKRTRKREEIDPKYKWNIEAMYENESDWDADYKKAMDLGEEFRSFSGRLNESAELLLKAFRARDILWQTAEKVYVYARMKKDEDTRVAKYQAMSDKAHSLLAKISANTSFFTPELLEIPEDILVRYLEESEKLQLYKHVIRRILREKAHVLSQSEENLLAQISELTSATNDIFSMINNADIKFGTIIDEDGDEVEVTHGRYISLLESRDRRVRKEAFEKLYAAYEAQKNTLAMNYNYNTKTDVVGARIRKYPSSLDAALSGDDIPLAVYENLVSVVNENLPLLHRYMEIRRKALGLDRVHMYDVYTPIADAPMGNITYENALEIVCEGLKPLGDEYISILKNGIADGWIDVYENEGKTSGAYSFGSYDSMPYVLLNYNGRLKDVFTIAHELGHSMHSYYTRNTQPFVYGGHSIFTAEVASTVNENLLMHDLISKETDLKKKKYLLNLHIEEFRATLFRQTMFAEFELATHKAVEDGEVLTVEWLCNTYLTLNRKYFGEKVVHDDQIAMEWSRIPHFYNAFYVYKYATGYSAAVALSDRILKGESGSKEAYIEFLKSGESNDPIPLLRLAGVDMSKPEPIKKAMNTFETLVNDLEKMI